MLRLNGDAYAAYKNINHTGSVTITISINWDRWQQVGIAKIAEKQHEKLTGKKMTGGISRQEALEIFDYILAEPLPQLAVSAYDLPFMIKQAYAFKASSFMEGIEGDTPTKIKRKRPDLDSEYVPPSNDTEKQLMEIWKDILGIEKIGINDNFIDLGGHSLRATLLVSRIHKILNQEITLKQVFDNPTIAGIAHVLEMENQKINKLEQILQEVESFTDNQIDQT